MTRIVIRLEGVEEVIRQFKATPKQIQRASKRAITRTLQQIETPARREIAKAHDIPVKALRKKGRYRGRVIKRRAKSGRSGSIWFGRNPIKSGYVGTPRPEVINGKTVYKRGSLRNVKTKGGAVARKHFFSGGFVAKMQSGHIGIFKRRGNAGRIDETKVALDRAEPIIRRHSQASNRLFKKVFQQQLNFEVNVRGGNN